MKIEVGDVIRVGEFFWISDRDFIGYRYDAKHGHGLDRSPGSVDVGCELEVLELTDTHAIVRLHRPKMPYGAPAAIGTVFKASLSMMASWPEKLKRINEHEQERQKLAVKYCRR